MTAVHWSIWPLPCIFPRRFHLCNEITRVYDQHGKETRSGLSSASSNDALKAFRDKTAPLFRNPRNWQRYTCHRWNWQQPSVGWWQCSQHSRETNSIVFVIIGTRFRSYRHFSGAARNWMNCIRIQTDSYIIVSSLRHRTHDASRNCYYYLLGCDANQSGKKFTDVSEECYSTI
jgi:hypothetical protein